MVYSLALCVHGKIQPQAGKLQDSIKKLSSSTMLSDHLPAYA